jgi:hypothetical protein
MVGRAREMRKGEDTRSSLGKLAGVREQLLLDKVENRYYNNHTL